MAPVEDGYGRGLGDVPGEKQPVGKGRGGGWTSRLLHSPGHILEQIGAAESPGTTRAE